MIKKRKIQVAILILLAVVILIKLKTSMGKVDQTSIEETKLNASLYYPMKKMTKIFKSSTQDEGFVHIVDRISDDKVQIKQVDLLTRVIMVYEVSSEQIRLIYTEEVGNEDFKEDYISDINPNRDDSILISPIETGTSWNDHEGGTYRIVKTDEIVDTPAGEFETVVVKYENSGFNVKEYYAKEIGLVRIIVNNYGVYELEEININEQQY